MRALLAALGLGWLLGAPAPLTTEPDLPQPAHDVTGAFDEVSAAFEARLLAAHPPGSPVAALEDALRAEGFATAGEGEARLERDGFMCELVWVVTWTEKAAAVATIDGRHFGVCL